MKILFTFYIAGSGVETLNRQRFAALKKYGVESHALYLTKGSGWKNIEASGMTAFVTNDEQEIKRIFEIEKYDLIFVCADYLFLSKIRKLGFNGKIVYDIQGFGTEIDQLLKKAKPFVEEHAAAILSPNTSHLITKIKKALPDKQLYSFHNGIDTKLFSKKEVEAPQKRIIGWVGRIEENKNWKLFLRLGRHLLNQQFDIELWMFEDPTLSMDEQRKQFARWLKRLELTEHVKMFANIPHGEMPIYYSKIAKSGGFFCSTSLLEGFGYAPLEAMSCQCPVLCTDSDGVKSFVIHNRTGKIIPKNRLQKAVLEAKDMLTNAPLRSKLVQNGLNLIQHEFSLEKYGESFIKMLKHLGYKQKE